MRDTIVIGRAWLVRLGFALGRMLPVRRRILLATGHASRIGGNLEAIRSALAQYAQDVPMTILAQRPRDGLAGRLRTAIMGLRSGYELARSRLCVLDDYYFPAYVVKPRQGTTLVQAWHASGAFKKFGYSLTGKTFGADASVLRRVRIHSTYHLCLVSTMRVAAHYAEAFGLPAERFTSRIGIPRTDSLLDPAWRDRTADAIRRRYSIPGDRRVVLYAPTFRGTSVTRARDAATLDLALLRERLGNTHFVLARRHPFVRGRGALAETLAGFGADVSEHPDIHELMTVTDVLVTDYSSAIFEFALLGRPIAFFAPDLAQYEHERGFYLDYRRDVPGPIFDTTAALAKHLRAGEFDLDRVRRFAADAFDVADGHAAERFVEEIVRPALGTSR